MKEQEILIDYLRKLESKLEEIAHSVHTNRMPAHRPHPDLSKREQEIFDLIGKGEDSSTIAEQLGLNVQTIHSYRHRIKQKLNIHNNTALLHSAFCHVYGISK